jgi:hypothetical protein
LKQELRWALKLAQWQEPKPAQKWAQKLQQVLLVAVATQ